MVIWLLALIHSLAAEPCRAPDLCANYVVMTRTGEPVVLNRARFVGADYLIAGTAPGVASRFGHSMLRLNFCGPGPGPCRADDVYAIDIGFSAQVDTEVFSAIGGVLGRYPSRLIVTPDLDLRTHYNEDELRDLRAYPLALDDRTKDRLLAEIGARFWTSTEPYRFFSNNCAGGLLDLLGATLPPDHPIHRLTAFLLTPRGLLEQLRAFGLAGHAGNVWRSRRPGLEARMVQMRKIGLNLPGSVEAYLQVSPPTRRVWVEAAPTLADVLILSRLEAFAVRATRSALVKALITQAERTPARCAPARADVLDAYANLRTERLKQGPEVPADPDELASEGEVRARLKTLGTALTALVPCYQGVPNIRRLRAFERLSLDNLRRARVRAASL